MDKAKIRIVLADDHKTVREGVRSLLAFEPDFEVVGEASDGEMAVQIAHHTHPDIVLMDINMPKLNGIEATKQIKRDAPEIAVIALSMHNDQLLRQAMSKAGTNAYVRKDETPEILFSTIRETYSHRHAEA